MQGDGQGQGGLACCSPWGHRVGHDWATQQEQVQGVDQKRLAVLCIRECSARFSPRVFIVSSLTFRSLIHLEFIFVYGVRSVLLLFFYM